MASDALSRDRVLDCLSWQGKFYTLSFHVIEGGGRNFEGTNVERSMFRNLKIANGEGSEKFCYSIFLFRELFFQFFKIEHFFFNFNALIFYNFSNLIFLGFKFFV